MTNISEEQLKTWKIIIENSGLFDAEYYLKENPDVAAAGMDPLIHYLEFGWREGRLSKEGVISNKRLNPVQFQKNNSITRLMQFINNPTETDIQLSSLLAPNEIALVQEQSLDANKGFSLDQNKFQLTQALIEYFHFIDCVNTLQFIQSLMRVVYESQKGSKILTSLPDYLSEILDWIKDHNKPLLSDEIDVSIIIPAFNNIDLTLTAIASILASDSKYTYEIIVADDCSSDITQTLIPTLGNNIRNLRNNKNLGFLNNCNNAINNSRGKYLVLLNNDVITLPNWLNKLIEPLEKENLIGLVGSKLLNSDGSLQEAGGIFWNDGSAWNYGRNQDPRKPEFNYAKEVDYISGASIALRRTDWEALGGFDIIFSPAYCEDSDLAFRVRKAGKKVWYNPSSVLIHHEGMSHGRDVSFGTKAYQIANSEKLNLRWREVLEHDHFPNAQDLFLARDRSKEKPHMLIVDHYIPQKDRDAGSRTIYDCIRYFLSKGMQITFWPDNLNLDKNYAAELQELGVEIIYGVDYLNKFDEWWIENGMYFEFAFLSRSHISKNYIDTIKKNHKAKIFYYGHDLAWSRLLMEYELKSNQELLQIAQNSKIEEDIICNKSDFIIYPSKNECDYARSAFPFAKGVIEMPAWLFDEHALMNSIKKVDDLERASKNLGLFVGGFNHTPNLDAINWFIDDILPIIIKDEPTFKIQIVGSNMPAELLEIKHPNIEAIGWVDDETLEQLRLSASCNIVPLRTGAGVKGKVIEAFAMGLPVVSTSVGMQGIESSNDLAFMGDSARDFANAVLKCSKDRGTAKIKSKKALEFISKNYTFSAMDMAFSDFLNIEGN